MTGAGEPYRFAGGREGTERFDCGDMVDDLFAKAQQAIVDRVRAVMGVPPEQLGRIVEALWKTDGDTRIRHLVYLNQPLCPVMFDRIGLVTWLPSYTAEHTCVACAGIDEHARALQEERETAPANEGRQAGATSAGVVEPAYDTTGKQET